MAHRPVCDAPVRPLPGPSRGEREVRGSLSAARIHLDVGHGQPGGRCAVSGVAGACWRSAMDFGAGQIVPSMGAQSPRPSMASARPTQGTIGQTPGIARPLARRCPIAPAPGTCCTGPSALPGLPIRPGHFSVFGAGLVGPGQHDPPAGALSSRSRRRVPRSAAEPSVRSRVHRPRCGPERLPLARKFRRPARQPARGAGPSRRAPAARGARHPPHRRRRGRRPGCVLHHDVRRRRHPRGPARPGPPYIEGAPVLNESGRAGRPGGSCGGALRAEAGGGTSAGPHGRPQARSSRCSSASMTRQRRTPRSTNPWWTRWASPTDGAGGRGRPPATLVGDAIPITPPLGIRSTFGRSRHDRAGAPPR